MSSLRARMEAELQSLPPGPIAVAFSGGLDSSVLLHCLAASDEVRQRGLRAIHVNHQLHADSEAWAAHCAKICHSSDVPFETLLVRVDRDRGSGLEASARDARHAAIQSAMRREEIIAFAHHRDDQAETVLLRLLRGAGPEGMAAMRSLRRFGPGLAWRPLLAIPRNELVAHAKAHKSKIIVPAFALGRTQDLVMRIKRLVAEGRIDPLPIYIDSPLASKVTDVFRKHPECYDEETFRTFTSEGDPFAARYIRYVSSPEESKRLNEMKGPCVIIASSGMCEGGRVVHHLKHGIQDEANIIAIVGFQAEHTLGRRLVEGWDVVPIFGIPTPRRAQVVVFNGLSAHADRNDLLAYVRAISPAPQQVFVVHGEEKQALSLGAAIQTEHPGMAVVVPAKDSIYEI